MATSRPSEKVLNNYISAVRKAEFKLLVSLRKVRSIVPTLEGHNVTPASNLSFTSAKNLFEGEDLLAGSHLQTPRTARLESQGSTTAVWSEGGEHRVSPLQRVVEESSQLDVLTSSATSGGQSRRTRQRDRDPFYIFEEFKPLQGRYEHYGDVTGDLHAVLNEEDPLAVKVQQKYEHYVGTFDDLEHDMKDYIWEVSHANQHPLPGPQDYWDTHRERAAQRRPAAVSTPLSGPVVDSSLVPDVAHTNPAVQAQGQLLGIQPTTSSQPSSQQPFTVPTGFIVCRPESSQPGVLTDTFAANAVSSVPTPVSTLLVSLAPPPVPSISQPLNTLAASMALEPTIGTSSIASLVPEPTLAASTTFSLVTGTSSYFPPTIQSEGGRVLSSLAPAFMPNQPYCTHQQVQMTGLGGVVWSGLNPGQPSVGGRGQVPGEGGGVYGAHMAGYVAVSSAPPVTSAPGMCSPEVCQMPQQGGGQTGPSEFEKFEANRSYQKEKKAIEKSVQTVEGECTKSESWTPQMPALLVSMLDGAEQRLSVELKQNYLQLCHTDYGRAMEYATEYSEFCETWEDRICVARVQVASVKPSPSELSNPQLMAPQPSNSVNFRHLPRLVDLKFSGRIEDWPEFRRDWRARYGKLADDVQIQYLKPALPSKDQAKVAAVSSMTECWKRLEKTYGDRNLNIVTVKHNLRGYQPKGTHRWEKAIDLHECIEKAVTQLDVLEAVSSLSHDFELIATLVSKLPVDYQEEWDKFSVDGDSSGTDWDKFWSWMECINQRAIASKLRNLTAGGPTNKQEFPVCSKCKVKHKLGQRCERKEQGVKTPPVVHGHLTLSKITNQSQLKEYVVAAKPAAGKCPACSKPHTYERKFSFGKADVPSHRFHSCPAFKSMTPKQRGEAVEKSKGCWKCLDWIHGGDDCPVPNEGQDQVRCAGWDCCLQ